MRREGYGAQYPPHSWTLRSDNHQNPPRQQQEQQQQEQQHHTLSCFHLPRTPLSFHVIAWHHTAPSLILAATAPAVVPRRIHGVLASTPRLDQQHSFRSASSSSSPSSTNLIPSDSVVGTPPRRRASSLEPKVAVAGTPDVVLLGGWLAPIEFLPLSPLHQHRHRHRCRCRCRFNPPRHVIDHHYPATSPSVTGERTNVV